MSLPLAIRYGVEIPSYLPQFREEVSQLSLNGMSVSISMPDAGSAVFGAAVYDIGRCTQTSNAEYEQRQKCRRLCGLSMKFMNLLDDAIDDPNLALSPEQKRELVTSSVGQIWERSHQVQISIPETPFFSLAMTLGGALCQEVNQDSPNDSYAKTMYAFADAEAAQGEDLTPEGLLKSVINLGKPCGAIMANSVEFITGNPNDGLVTAAESLGVYGMILDHAFEVNADLRDNSPTIVTEMVRRYGDSRETRKTARELCLDQASDFRRLGLEHLNRRQQSIYLAIAKLFDLRYKVLVRMTDSLIR